jgi:hypothetical protein
MDQQTENVALKVVGQLPLTHNHLPGILSLPRQEIGGNAGELEQPDSLDCTNESNVRGKFTNIVMTDSIRSKDLRELLEDLVHVSEVRV